jgi:N-acetylglucosaminyldiphosphoundecaprenol N-acetyl-beta-D-mannosaminyltransferase
MIFNEDKIITNENEVLTLIKNYRDTKRNLLLTYLNQHCYNLYITNSNYRKILDEKFNVYMDGTGIFYALKLFKHKNIQRFNASDLNEKLFEYFRTIKERVFIIGGNFINEKIQLLIKNGLNICGYQNGFFNSESESRIIDDIKNTEPDVIIIGMGIPKQELFASELSKKLNGKKIICVGNFLEFYLGTVKRIPKIFRNSGLEWLFRLITEPARLWRRYILGIPLFIFSIIKLKLKLSKN